MCSIKHVGYGDPFSENEKVFPTIQAYEREVIYFYSKLWNLPEEKAWGYITSCSSEAIMYGMWSAKCYFKSLNFKKKPVIIFSQSAHYVVNEIS